MSSGFTHEAPGGGSVEWYTPSSIFDALRDEAGERLTFDLDPCAPPGGLPWIPARRFLSLPDDGLAAPWAGRVWCNPPYTAKAPACGPCCGKTICGKRGYHLEKPDPGTGGWLRRMAAHGNGIALVFARPDNAWFHEAVAGADATLFIAGRVRFVDASGKPPRTSSGPGNGSMLLAWGDVCASALRRSGLGLMVVPAPSATAGRRTS